MAARIRLMRFGSKRAPRFRVVVADSRSPRDGRFIESIGTYHPTEEPSRVEIDLQRAQAWLANGAQPTEAVTTLLGIAGIADLPGRKPARRASRQSQRRRAGQRVGASKDETG